MCSRISVTNPSGIIAVGLLAGFIHRTTPSSLIVMGTLFYTRTRESRLNFLLELSGVGGARQIVCRAAAKRDGLLGVCTPNDIIILLFRLGFERFLIVPHRLLDQRSDSYRYLHHLSLLYSLRSET